MKTGEMLISIVVPIYGVEKYIAACIDSILAQSYRHFELILVDDGSPDKAGEICEQYLKVDSRVIVLHKNNGGLSDARNYGLKYASGEYITFIDSDDLVERDFIKTLVDLVVEQNADISCVNSYTTYERTLRNNTSAGSNILVLDGSDALEHGLFRKGFGISAWGKLYKRELFNDIEFPKGKLYEDIQTVPFLFLKCNKIASSSAQLYLWYQRKDSIMHMKVDEKHLCFFDDLRVTMDKLLKINIKLEDALICRYCEDTFATIIDRLVYDDEYSEKIKIVKKKAIDIWRKGLKKPCLSKKRKVQLRLIIFNSNLYRILYKIAKHLKKVKFK